MLALLRFHELAAKRGDGLRREFLRLRREPPVRTGRLTLVSDRTTDTGHQPLDSNKRHDPPTVQRQASQAQAPRMTR